MSGGIRDVRAEDIIGRGAYVKDIYLRRMKMQTMKWVFWMIGNYGSHTDDKYDPNALPDIWGINYKDVVADDVRMAVWLKGIQGDPITGICMSNVMITLGVKGKKKIPWTCLDVEGTSSGVTPPLCDALNGQCYRNDFQRSMPIDDVELKQCSFIKCSKKMQRARYQ